MPAPANTTKPPEGSRAPREDQASQQRWDNEGGATPHPAERTARPPGATGSISIIDHAATLDGRQDELMTIASTDGRPPSHRQRREGWRMLGACSAVLVTLAVLWEILGSSSTRMVIAPLAVLALVCVLIGANPVLWAGLLRGREERSARRTVTLEEHSNTTGASAGVVMAPERGANADTPVP